jgi:prepilin-type N-terminal cleavage/methylation domain-containing protein
MSRKRTRGYTAIEVMIGITLLSIGAAAVISMQRGAIQANLDARKMDMANSIAREWLERLRRDATLWTLPSPVSPAGNNYSNAQILSQYLVYGSNTTNSVWKYPDILLQSATVPDGVSPGFDILGRDLMPTDIAGTSTKPSAAVFCVNIRLNWLVMNQLIRAEVRVFWPRMILSGPNTTDWCTDANASAVTGDVADYHFVYAATALRQNTVQ